MASNGALNETMHGEESYHEHSKLLSYNLRGGTEGSHEKPQSELPGPGIENRKQDLTNTKEVF